MHQSVQQQATSFSKTMKLFVDIRKADNDNYFGRDSRDGCSLPLWQIASVMMLSLSLNIYPWGALLGCDKFEW